MSAGLQELEKFSNMCTNKLAKGVKVTPSFTVGSREGRTDSDKLMTMIMRLHSFKKTSRKVLFC